MVRRELFRAHLAGWPAGKLGGRRDLVVVGGMKMVLGILITFAWRILAKSILHVVLPPIFRLLAHAFTLPHRRFYTPATDYTSVPPEKGLYPNPPVIDLPNVMDTATDMDVGAGGNSPAGFIASAAFNCAARSRLATQEAYLAEKAGLGLGVDNYRAKEEAVKHYDAHVEYLLVSVQAARRSAGSCGVDECLRLLRDLRARVGRHSRHGC
ncbi:hypothetical protein FOMPIDRAFT_1045088 [Fomitopsis schrenkii]|uniref:Uncharacterized protein n=1 Tax=Fomitopsis schrenkii TaxID=2126942 RepID=S8EL10_FOMSC|nr:hypothetical protein FOMPIDRAFT_1045088 [Fomitopsis schrenkii]